jgi:acetyl-CoA carboxylase, biotin carboxylase subunit
VKRVLVANRGEIAVRVIGACRAIGLETVAIYSEADRAALPARLADRAVCIGPARAAESYLNIGAVLAAARGTGCDAVHPGYGFLAENAEFAERCAEYGLTFVGPPAEVIRLMGDKIGARRFVAGLGVPVVSGTDAPLESAAAAGTVAEHVGYPLLLKAAAGGGGRGMRVVHDAGSLPAAFESARAEAHAAFGDGRLYVERFLDRVRHVEVQILADGHDTTVHLGERDCSLQRRHQKLIEEAPAPGLDERLRRELAEAAVVVARKAGYRGAGTIEFLVDAARGRYYFLEMNTRIQVEHPVTEMVTGVDLVVAQLRVAAGEPVTFAQSDIRVRGHAIECRINAESPAAGFRPSPGTISAWQPPTGDGIRVDTHCYPGYVVPPFYDSLLAKLIAAAEDRETARRRLRDALDRFVVDGVATTIAFHRRILDSPEFVGGEVHTRWVEESFLPASAP